VHFEAQLLYADRLLLLLLLLLLFIYLFKIFAHVTIKAM